MSQKPRLTDSEIKTEAVKYGLTFKQLKAVVVVESAGAGFDANGKIKIQFEPHKFKERTKVQIDNKVDIQSKEWEAFEAAKKIDENAAYESTSWGLGQIMGFNCRAAGFKTAKEMAEAFMVSEAAQLAGMMRFLAGNPVMLRALKANDWKTFARLYNGPKYAEAKPPYDQRLSEAHAKAKDL